MSSEEVLYGRQAVLESLRAGRRRIHRLLVAHGALEQGSLAQAIAAAAEQKIPVESVERSELERHTPHHQGVVGRAEPYPYVNLQAVLDQAAHRGEPLLVLLLDLLQDPQNLGTLLRTAEAVGVHGVLLAKRRSVGVTPAVVASSAGAAEHLLIARVNLAQAMRQLKRSGAWLVGLERSSQAQPLERAELSGPLGLVVGSEGQGLRRLVRDSCDFLIELPMRGKVASLNAAVAGSIALYRAYMQRERGAKDPQGRRQPGAH